ncbi:cobalt-precorrin 5A acetaldehyde-lyase [Desulfotomaculum arcticum]|uniref:Cobalt-precorrin 5A acetaldehyde-lyase n=1 Tax=Desulfotruncus arcticus DSM 17038 TaxID=1121424 RepID=A0A1I2S391_9FIRM|nr:cobalt-precorrin 5A hydrolase [Desulfotruncus arcticus]SFG44546.1 cobalt-precorrin 5A acetaldehyde-lyase [Desulfotomaculum arcticum] [Desulfotruncus arcticus DSM 17038]
MKTAVICITRRSYNLGSQIKRKLGQNGSETDLYLFNQGSDRSSARADDTIYFKSLSGLVREIFPLYRQIIFIMALGIVVRVIASLVKSKTTDPAVLVIDENGNNVISVLSGHLGGANKLTRHIAELIGAKPVITTATDVQGLPAVDDLAREYNYALDPVSAVKAVNSAIVNGGMVYFYGSKKLKIAGDTSLNFLALSDYPNRHRSADFNVIITNEIIPNRLANTLFLRPRNLVVGIGCRSGTSADKLLDAINTSLEICNRSPLSLRAIATIQLKAAEPGLIQTAAALKIPVLTFSADEINCFINETNVCIQHSDFVQKNVGVPAVCEPAALMATGKGELLLPKQKFPGITVAVAEDPLQ